MMVNKLLPLTYQRNTHAKLKEQPPCKWCGLQYDTWQSRCSHHWRCPERPDAQKPNCRNCGKLFTRIDCKQRHENLRLCMDNPKVDEPDNTTATALACPHCKQTFDAQSSRDLHIKRRECITLDGPAPISETVSILAPERQQLLSQD